MVGFEMIVTQFGIYKPTFSTIEVPNLVINKKVLLDLQSKGRGT